MFLVSARALVVRHVLLSLRLAGVGFEKTALVDRGCCSKRVYTEYKGANFRWVRVELKQRIVVRCRVRGLDGRIGRE